MPFAVLNICRKCTFISSQSPGGYRLRKYEYTCQLSYERETIAIEYNDGTIKESLMPTPQDCPYILEHTLLDPDFNG